MADTDRHLTAAIARKLRDCAGADPDVTARELVLIVKVHGYRHVIIPPPERHGGGPPGPGVATLLAEARAACEASPVKTTEEAT